MKKQTKRLLVIAGAAAAGSLIAVKLYRMSADRLMKLALDREEPKDIQKSKEKLMKSAEKYGKSPYGEHLRHVAEGKFKY